MPRVKLVLDYEFLLLRREYSSVLSKPGSCAGRDTGAWSQPRGLVGRCCLLAGPSAAEQPAAPQTNRSCRPTDRRAIACIHCPSPASRIVSGQTHRAGCGQGPDTISSTARTFGVSWTSAAFGIIRR
jgi:hypothetical protein